MERLDDFSSDDLISALVDDLRVQSTLFCRSLLTAPWGFAVAARDLAVFHIVLAGRCHLAVDGVEKGVALAAGDLVILPQGQQHSVRDSPTSPVTALEDLLGAAGFEGFELRHGGGAPATELLCGGFAVGREEAPCSPDFLRSSASGERTAGPSAGWRISSGCYAASSRAPSPVRAASSRASPTCSSPRLSARSSRAGTARLSRRSGSSRTATSQAPSPPSTSSLSTRGRWPSWQCERPCRARRLRLGSGSWSANRRCTTCGVAGSPARLRICAQTT